MRFPSLHYISLYNIHSLQGSSIDWPRISQLGAPRNPVVIRVLTTAFAQALGKYPNRNIIT
jgi:hypothetical protein